jgi:hypothetical protein
MIIDQDEDVHRAIDDYVREGLLEENHYKMWRRDFEDLFDSKRIVTAMKKLSEESKFKFEITAAELETQRKIKPVVQSLKEYMYNTNSLPFKKVDLAKELAKIIEQEIYSGVHREETDIEKEIKQVMDIISKSMSS